jgi:gliding motility-associated-like protein/uncharacterized repeat protein (TIGR01451 family)
MKIFFTMRIFTVYLRNLGLLFFLLFFLNSFAHTVDTTASRTHSQDKAVAIARKAVNNQSKTVDSNLDICPILTGRVYADTQSSNFSLLGTVSNGEKAVDKDPKTFSTITTNIVLLGIGTQRQNLQWNTVIEKGTPVTIKLGSNISIAELASGLTVIGTKRNLLGYPVEIGLPQPVSGALLNLLSGQGSYEFTFIPKSSSGDIKDYDGIKIVSSGLVSVAKSIDVYEAYYHKDVAQASCTTGDVLDIFSGVTTLGIGALTSLVSVSDPWNVADNDSATYATMRMGVGVLAAADLTVAFKTPSMAGDSLRLVVSSTQPLLQLNLITAFSIQRFLGNVAVGEPIASGSSLLSLKLLNGGSQSMILVSPHAEPYDRVRIRFGGVASVLSSLNVHSVDRVGNTKVIGGDLNNKVAVCSGGTLTLEVPPTACSTYNWYSSPVGGSILATGTKFSIPTTLTPGTHKFYVQPVRFGCENLSRGEVTVLVRVGINPPADIISGISINGGAGASICSESKDVTLNATLKVASGATNPIYHWYRGSGTTSQLVSEKNTSQLELKGLAPGIYTYSLGVSSDEYCEIANLDRKTVTFAILDYSDLNDIEIASTLTASCVGAVVLSPKTTVVGAEFKYYTSQQKTQEITTGYAGHSGVSYVKNATTGALTITGLSVMMKYYISIVVGGSCETNNDALKEVKVEATPVLDLHAELTGCGTVNLGTAIKNPDTTGSTTYAYFKVLNIPITEEAAKNITISGDYFIQAQVDGNCPSTPVRVTVKVDPLPTLVDVDASRVVNIGATVTLNGTSNGTIVWYNSVGDALGGNSTGVLSSGGTFTYTVIATLGSCTVTKTTTINVIDPTSCESLTQRVYANKESSGSIITGGVSNGASAVDRNPQTFSTITTGVGLLGIGTTWQNLQWDKLIPKGTAVTIKLGADATAVVVAGGVSVVGTKRNSSGDPIDIGVLQPVSGSLLKLLSGENNFEFTFVPSNGTGPKDYDGIRISSGALLSVAQNTKVYEAYYHEKVTQIACGQGDIQDIFYGVVDLGIGAVTAGAKVSNPWNIADDDDATFATLFTGLGVLAGTELTVAFKTPTMVSDTLRLVVSSPGKILNLNLLTGFTIQRFLGTVPVGAPIGSTSTLLSLKLLTGDSAAMVLVFPQAEPYDRVRIRLAGVAGVFDLLQIHSIDRVANTKVVGADLKNKIVVCLGNVITLEVPSQACSTYNWYDSAVGGTIVATGHTFTIPNTLEAGIHKFYIQAVRFGCEVMSRGEVTVVVNGAPTAASTQIFCFGDAKKVNDLVVTTGTGIKWYSAETDGTLYDGTETLISGNYYASQTVNGCESSRTKVVVTVSSTIGAPTTKNIVQSFCQASNPTFASIQVSPTVVVWYTAAIGGTQIPLTDVLVDGIYYAAAVLGSCESTERLKVTVNVTNDVPAVPTTGSIAQTFCKIANPTFASIKVSPTTVVWYSASTAGTAFALTDVLVSGKYYAASVNGGCESADRLEVTVTVADPAAPTTKNIAQSFCRSSNPTFASIQVNSTMVAWYSASTAGTAYALTAVLGSGTYYAASIVDGCEGTARLEVTVTVADPAAPTTNNIAQSFCKGSNPTFASIQVNQTTVVWYSAATGGTAYALTDVLASGKYYAASIVDGCEGIARLEVTVTVTDPAVPTTNNIAQTFCEGSNPTFASIQVSPTTVVWYTASTGGTAFGLTDVLVSGKYYAASVVGGCESTVRLEVTVTVTDPAAPTTNTIAQSFCKIANPTFASIQVSPTTVVWYSASSGGTAYALTDALVDGKYYAASIVDGCEGIARLEVTVTVADPVAPTAASTQTFCSGDAKKVSDLVVTTGAGIKWYSAVTGGTLYDGTETLISGDYFASQTANGCESSRTLVTVTVNTTPVAPTAAAAQTFCSADAKKVSDLVVTTGAGIKWYSAVTGGTLYDGTETLISGDYFASQTANGCESSRTLVAVTVNTTPIAPTAAASQTFCSGDAKKVSDLVVTTGAGIKWYSAVTGGTLYDGTETLISGDYFASQTANGCESSRTLVSVTVNTTPVAPTAAASQTFCSGDAKKVSDLVVTTGAGIKWYSAVTGGTLYDGTETLISGDYFASQTVNGCESSRTLVAVTVSTTIGVPTTNTIAQSFCKASNPTFASIQVSPTTVVWYSASTGGTAYALTAVLVSGKYYAASVVGGCESTARLEVTVTVADPAVPTTTNIAQTFCKASNPTFASIQVSPTTVVWYSASTGGTAYALADVLVSGKYYAASVVGGCEGTARLEVTVTVADPAVPTTNTIAQSFCKASNPTFASIQVSPTTVVWYSASTGGTAYALTAVLVSGKYYAASVVGGCESTARLEVTVTVADPVVPTTTNIAQTFCKASNPTFASIQVSPTTVVWYSASTGGTAYALTDVLVSGKYYAASVVGGCESTARLEVTVTVTDPAVPTSNNLIQDFCLSDNPTFASIQTNQTNVVWYSTETGGTALLGTKALTAGIYYAALKDATTGCESSIRLKVTVTFSSDNQAIITGGTVQSCVFDTVTYTTNSGMKNYLWTVSNGSITSGGKSTDNFVTVSWPTIGGASVNVSYADNCGISHNSSFVLDVKTCSDITISKTVDNPTPGIDDNVTFTITVNNTGKGYFKDLIISENIPTGYLFVSANASIGTYNNISGNWDIPLLDVGQKGTLMVTVKVLPTGDYLNIASIKISNPEDSDINNNNAEASVSPLCLIVYNEFSPNNDGNNDLFRIDCIENYPNNKLEIFNRYGALVYSKNKYINDWDGKANVSGAINKDDKLPAGTYYYTLNLGTDGIVKTGWLSIIR